MKSTLLPWALCCALGLWPPAAAAQQAAPAAPDTLRLGALHQDALGTDPRRRQFELQEAQTELRLGSLATERLPALTGEARTQYQSDVPDVASRLPAGSRVLSPPQDTYDAYLTVQQPILDPTIGPRRAVERAQLTESQARVRTTLFGLRQEVNEAFFGAALLQERAGELAAVIDDLAARLREVGARVREGTALPGEAAVVEATLLQRRQDHAGVRAERRAALDVLASLVGRPIDEGDVLALPDLGAAVARARGLLTGEPPAQGELPDGQPSAPGVLAGELRARPEYEQFASARARLRVQEDVVDARRRPRLSAFGRAGYGRPGLDFLNDQFDPYWLAGVQVQWAPWDWGAAGRERQALALQRQIVAADEAAFTSALRRSVQRNLAALDRLDTTLALDDEIVPLRERIEREARLRFQEGVITAAEYLDRRTDVLEARLARAAHRVEQAQARARFLTTLGLEVQ